MLVDKIDPASGYARLCNDVTGQTDCTKGGSVTVAGDWAYHVSADRFGPYYGLDCRYTQVAAAHLTRTADGIVASTTSTIATPIGDECAELEARMQQDSASANPLKNSWIEATYRFTRATAP